jgi:hypothetical protein
MTSTGRGLLAVWTDVEPSAEAEFNAWYNHEHLAERAAIPGFLNARRYGAADAKPRYFAAYDTERLTTLGAPPYLKALRNQSAWSLRTFPHFRNNTRMIAAQVANHGTAMGGAMFTVRLAPRSGGAAALAQALGERIVEPTAALAGIVRVTVAVGVVAGLDAEPAEPARLAAEAPAEVALLVEGDDLPALRLASQQTLREQALLDAGAERVLQSGLYRMLCAVVS